MDGYSIEAERGEVGITLAGKVYPMRPDYRACAAIETKLGPITSLAYRLALPTQGLTVREMAIIVAESIRSAGDSRNDTMLKSFSIDRVAELIFDGALLGSTERIETLLINMTTGGAKPRGKEKKGEAPPASTSESTIDG